MQKLIMICLNIDEYKKLFNDSPQIYLKCCNVPKQTNNLDITETDKLFAVNQYFIKNDSINSYAFGNEVNGTRVKYKNKMKQYYDKLFNFYII